MFGRASHDRGEAPSVHRVSGWTSSVRSTTISTRSTTIPGSSPTRTGSTPLTPPNQATAGPISRIGAAAVMGLAATMIGAVAVRAAGAGAFLSTTTLVVLLSIPLWIVASTLTAVVTVDGRGLRRRGWIRTTELGWDEVVRISTSKGLFGLSGLTAHGRRRKVGLSSAMPGFRTAALVVLAEASERGVELRSPWASGPEDAAGERAGDG